MIRRDEAEVLHLDRGQQLTEVTVRLPPALPQRRISGKVTLHGQPVANATVALGQPGYLLYADSVDTDANGEFSLRGFQGYDYFVIAQKLRYRIGYIGRAEAPPNLEGPIEVVLERRK